MNAAVIGHGRALGRRAVAGYALVFSTQLLEQLHERITRGRGWNAFGYLAAEADLARMGRP